ncbi:MAG TPA: DNA polymerase III subunit beta [Chloroflexota bacterium]|nr:DNA polymerase III subunit beta [Chloroflexota bacterium]
MKLTIDQATLNRALRAVGRVAPTRTTLPILQATLLTANEGRLTLNATDTELALTTTVAADVAEPGAVALSARLLSDYVAQLPPEPIRLILDSTSHRVRVSCGRFTAHLATQDPADFPMFPTVDPERALDLDASRLHEAISRVAFAAARDESRPVLSGVLFDFTPTGLTLVATDGFRLARAQVAGVVGPEQQLLVPARAVAEFGRLLSDADAARLVLTSDNRGLHLIVKDTVLYTRLIEGHFPDIERVIPRSCQTTVVIETAAFRQAVLVAGLFGASGDARPVVLDAAPGRLQLRARGDETGDAESELPATVQGKEQTIVLNTRLLADVLEVTTSAQVEVTWDSPQTPVILREAAQAECMDLSLVMPLHDPSLARPAQKAA